MTQACKSTKTQEPADHQTMSIEELAKNKLGQSARIVYNKTKSAALVMAITRENQLKEISSLKFFVYDIASSTIILEDFIAQGNVEWVDQQVIKVTKIPGVYNPDNPTSGYFFEVATQKKSPIKN